MSHFSRIKTRMKDERAIVAALEELGCRSIEVHEKPQRLGSSYSAARRQKMQAHIIVRGGSADFGLLRGEDGTYEAIGDTMYDHISDRIEKLPMTYAKQVITLKAKELGDEFTVEERFENGKLIGYSIVVEKATQQSRIGQSSITSGRLSIGGRY